jgi:hypothetical protein
MQSAATLAARWCWRTPSVELPLIKQELLDSAEICEEVANDIEDRLPGG